MRELWGDIDPFVATGRQWSLLVQRLRSLLQDERSKPATHQAQEATGEYFEVTIISRIPRWHLQPGENAIQICRSTVRLVCLGANCRHAAQLCDLKVLRTFVSVFVAKCGAT